jgi:hydroxymethylpyrimidine pyrophosphatase-like HAD family hydrolase
VKLRVLALDYDGTIALDGRMHASLPAAITHARQQGILVALVTGRRLDDLRRLIGDLHLFDLVVAENGSIAIFPASGRSARLAPTNPPRLLEALHAAGIGDAVAGECLVEMDAARAGDALAVVRRLELPLTLHFNRGRLMILPPAVTKGTGLREALRQVRTSPHNAVAIGDAENDHELLAACEAGVAVAWGSRALLAAADFVIEGDGPEAVADYVRRVVSLPAVPHAHDTRRRLLLGTSDTGEPVSLAVRGRNVLVTGEPRTGKSWAAGLLAEQLILYGYSVCVIDPEGDYAALEQLPGVVLLGGDEPLPSLQEVTRMLRHPDVSLVLDLVRMPLAERRRYTVRALAMLSRLRQDTGLPHRIMVDEAHTFLADPEHTASLDFAQGGYTLVTYRASEIPRHLLDATTCVVVTRETEPREIRLLRETWKGVAPLAEWEAALSSLDLREAVLLPVTEEAQGHMRKFRLAPRHTPHVRHRHKYLDVGVPDSRAFLFQDGADPPRSVRSLAELVAVLDGPPHQALSGHLRRGDLSRWVADVMTDRALADRLGEIEDGWRLGQEPDPAGAIVRAIQERYESG